MPELPEVEVTRRSFARAIEGARVVGVRVGKPLRWPLGCDGAVLVGRTVTTVGRRGKYLLLEFDSGVLLIHLGMSGSLRFSDNLPLAGVHDHFELQTTQGGLRLTDPRRFGAVVYVSAITDPLALKLLGKLGMEPLSDDFDVGQFCAGLKQRKSAIKQVLLAGQLVVGVGNIYASEALFLAKISPLARADTLGRVRCARLHAAIRVVLSQAVERGGSTLRDFSSADGQTGHFQTQAMVYGRAGLPCRACGTMIESMRQGQRSTFFCPLCQSA